MVYAWLASIDNRLPERSECGRRVPADELSQQIGFEPLPRRP